jgi:uncharacterized membrane protein
MPHRNRELFLISIATLVAIAVQLTSRMQTGWIYWTTGAYLALIAPGLGLSKALQLRTNCMAQITLVMGLSLISIIAGALILNLTPAGLQPISWATLLGVITLLGCLIGAIRRSRINPSKNGQTEDKPDSEDFKTSQGYFRSIMGFSLLTLCAAAALSIAFTGARHANGPGFTTMWAVPAGSSGSVRVGVRNLEDTYIAYILSIKSGSTTLQTRQIALKQSSSWEETINLPASPPQPLRLDLFRTDHPDLAYRSLILYPDSFSAAIKPQ